MIDERKRRIEELRQEIEEDRKSRKMSRHMLARHPYNRKLAELFRLILEEELEDEETEDGEQEIESDD
jgi:hypothetical protein